MDLLSVFFRLHKLADGFSFWLVRFSRLVTVRFPPEMTLCAGVCLQGPLGFFPGNTASQEAGFMPLTRVGLARTGDFYSLNKRELSFSEGAFLSHKLFKDHGASEHRWSLPSCWKET